MAKDRKVIYTLGLATDSGAAREAAAFAKHFKDVETNARAAQKAVKDASAAVASSGRSGKGGFGAGYDKAAAAESRRAMVDERREREANIRAVIDSQKNLDRATKQSAALTTKAWKDTGQAVGAATGAFVAYGRAVVLASAADEESAQRMLQKIAKFEAFASVLTGTISLVKAGTSAWKAYQAAAAAAALAQGAGMAGRAGMGGLLAGGLAAGAKTIGGAVGSAASNPLTGVAMLTAGVITAGYSVTRAKQAGKSAMDGLKDTGNLLYEGMTEFLGITDRAGDAAKAWEARMASGRENINSAGQRMIDMEGRRREISGLGRELSMLGGKTELDRAKIGLQHSQRGAANAEQRLELLPNYATKEARQAVQETLKNYRQQEIADVREISRIEAETRREKIEGERTALGMLRDRSRTAQQMLQAERDAKKSAAARFGDLSDSDKSRTIAAVRKAKAGGDVNRSERDFLRNMGGAGQTIADEAAAREAYKKGFGEVAAVTHDPRIYGAQARVNNLSTKIETKNEVIVRMERDAEATANASYEKLKPLFQKLYEFIAKQDQATADKLQADLDREAALVNGTGGG